MTGTIKGDAAARKAVPIATGVVDYWPDALVALAELSQIGNDQHNPGQPLHWSRDKSNDHGDCLMRHFVDRGKVDSDGVRHSTKVLWRAFAILQLELEAAARNVQIGRLPEESDADYSRWLSSGSVPPASISLTGRYSGPATHEDYFMWLGEDTLEPADLRKQIDDEGMLRG